MSIWQAALEVPRDVDIEAALRARLAEHPEVRISELHIAPHFFTQRVQLTLQGPESPLAAAVAALTQS